MVLCNETFARIITIAILGIVREDIVDRHIDHDESQHRQQDTFRNIADMGEHGVNVESV